MAAPFDGVVRLLGSQFSSDGLRVLGLAVVACGDVDPPQLAAPPPDREPFPTFKQACDAVTSLAPPVPDSISGSRALGFLFFGLEQIKRDIDDHVFLATDHAAPAQLDQNVDRLEAILLGGLLGVAQETRIDPGVP